MKKIILFILLCLPGLVNAQKIEEDKTDKFDGSRTVKTSYGKLASANRGGPLSVCGVYILGKDSVQTYGFIFRFPSRYTTSISHKDKAIIKLHGQDNVELPYSGGYDLVTGSEHVIYVVMATQEQIREIAAAPTSDVRLTTSDINMDFEIDDSKKEILQNISKLLLNI